jgi:hypothetical protein
MDLSKIVVLAQEGNWLPINTPDGQLIAEFLVVGRDSDECTLSVKQNLKKVRDRKGQLDIAASEEENKKTVIACIKDWRDPDSAPIDPKTKKPDIKKAKHTLTFGAEELVCDFLNKKRVLDEFGFIYRQVDQYIVDDSNFFKTAD